MNTLHVELGERSYPIWIASGLLKNVSSLLQTRGLKPPISLLIVSDTQVAPLYLNSLKESLTEAGYHVATAIVPNGEKSKSLEQLDLLVEAALIAGLDRKSAILALGGGVVGDLAGTLAATYMRGIHFVQIPTTILAHDSSVGGKVAVNHRLAKNIIGAFHQPLAVIYDLDTLQSLPLREVRAGLSEVLKHGLIWNRDFAYWVDENHQKLLDLEPNALAYALQEGCRVKAMIVSQDERESHLRAILNLGHTLGHAIEAVQKYDAWLHGEAIAVGMVAAAMVAVNRGKDPLIATETERMMRNFGLPVRIPASFDIDAIMSAMMHDKKNQNGTLTYILPLSIGEVEIVKNVPVEEIRRVVDSLVEEVV